jgi:hypothetical protein
VNGYVECIDTVKRIEENVKAVDKPWSLYDLADYIYLLVRMTSPCLVDFDIFNDERATLIIIVKHRDGTVVGKVHVVGEITIEGDLVFFKPVKTNVVEKGGE